MIITIASLKGGVGKTTTAFHVAAYLQSLADTVLVDGDPNRSAIAWSKQTAAPSFKVVSEKQLPKYASQFSHIVIDTQARPSNEDFADLVDTSDLLVLPSPPTFLDLQALIETIEVLTSIGCQKHKVLLTKVPTNAGSTDERDARELLEEQNIPVFRGRIRFYKAYEKAALNGISVNLVKGDRNAAIAWGDYKAVIEEALKEVSASGKVQ
jgi:chromosome partitioning protein